MSDGLNFAGAVASTTGHSVTLVEETSFCISSDNGDIVSGSAEGLFFLDTRFLSRMELIVDDHPTESLAVAREEPFGATFVVRAKGTEALDPTLVVFRRRQVGRGMVDRIELHNYAPEPISVRVEVVVDVDFADLFEVKEQRAPLHPRRRRTAAPDGLRFSRERHDSERRVSVTAHPEPQHVNGDRLEWTVELDGNAERTLCVEVRGGIGTEDVEPRFSCIPGESDEEPLRRLRSWRTEVPDIDCDDARLEDAVNATAEDLGALRLVDPANPEDVIVAAGAPWYMTLFGRDALLTAYMALPVDPRIALGVLRTLARLQGTRHVPETEEQPGRILHEIRVGEHPSLNLADGTIYYGTVDATPLFVMLLGELRRWGLADDEVDRLLPAADRALEWIDRWGDIDGDGFVEHSRQTPTGLLNQGWKDSWDGIRFADGRFPEGPIALCEVQGYVYSAFLARAFFAEEGGDLDAMRTWRERALELRRHFHEKFWIEDLGWFAMGLDGDKQQIDALASNMGHALWTGIVDPEVAPKVASRLMSPEMFSGWGIRTMATSMAAYNPVSYHLGSVWPHDSALCAAGLMRYGCVEEAHRLIDGLLDVSSHYDGHLPELLSGISREELPVPAVYPTSCMPQAWAAASPLLLLRSLLRLDPWMRRRQLWVEPRLPPWIQRLVVEGIPLGGSQIAICVHGHDPGGLSVEGVSPDIEVHRVARGPLTAMAAPDLTLDHPDGTPS